MSIPSFTYQLPPAFEQLSWTAVAGIDEVGRGAWFGPVVAAAVQLSETTILELAAAGVKDSKKLTPTLRASLSTLIRSKAIACRIGWASAREIDRLNILQATQLAMRRSVLKLDRPPQLCLVDGNRLIPNLSIPQQAIVKGDSHCIVIAASSILAKVWRDELMTRLDRTYPQYGLAKHKGYGTKQHKQALQSYGPCFHHRFSFAPVRQHLEREAGSVGWLWESSPTGETPHQ
ncbi:MAG: ribonuclease HII [Arthrospira platensis PCC 7345]|uniref:Ribonuclease HII n=1 Tax=Limnospira platensis NIES-46 TaxID=1236695 RepID=A0A5M3T592_LIMPL|nr:ribonuclease HII [Arthrospira platensis]MDT9294374.1 ribonuclease HII [Arthrospira platensis PCC 7345]GCE93060.1 ribonuclease HII [Arthrospira platensis NIES-46]